MHRLFHSRPFAQPALRLVLVASACVVMACPAAEPTEVLREVNGAFGANGRTVVATSSYLSTDLEAPFFNDATAHDYSTTVYTADGDLGARAEVLAYGEPGAGASAIAYSPLTFDGDETVAIIEHGEAIVVSSAGRVVLTPEGGLTALFGTLADGATAADVSIGPGGETIVAVWRVAYEGDSVFDLRFAFAAGFFERDGTPISAMALAWPDDSVDLALDAPHPALIWRPYALWANDGRAVYMLDNREAWRIPVDDPAAYAIVTDVPARSVPTESGAIDASGRHLVRIEDGNEATMVIETVEGWVPFRDIPLVPLADVDYPTPRFEP